MLDPHTRWIVVTAPDGPAALALERLLAHLGASAVARHGRWSVALEDTGDLYDEVAGAVRHWLRDRGLRTAQVAVGGEPRTVRLDEPLVAYDGPVLTHEP